jgi:NAD-dependent dihydropyrimidine dehydrogenase PreA subunit
VQKATKRREYYLVVEQGSWTLNKIRCKKCGICAGFCPAGSLMIDEDGFPGQSLEVKCRQCGLCERWCPDFAIVVGGAVSAR